MLPVSFVLLGFIAAWTDGWLTCAKRSCQTDIGTPIDRRHLSHTLWLRLQRYPVIHPCFSISILNDSGKRPTGKGACTYDFCQDVSNHILTSAKFSGFSTPSLPLVIIKFMQPPFLWLDPLPPPRADVICASPPTTSRQQQGCNSAGRNDLMRPTDRPCPMPPCPCHAPQASWCTQRHFAHPPRCQLFGK